MKRRQTTVLLLSMALVITSLSGCAREDLAEVRSKTQTDAVQKEVLLEQRETAGSGIPSYADYLEMNDGAAEIPEDVYIEIRGGLFSQEDHSNAYAAEYMGREGCLYWDAPQGSVSWEFETSQAGYYNLALTYCAVPLKNGDILFDILLDGELPYENAQNVSFRRLYQDETYFGISDHDFQKDVRGNELRPDLIEQFDWQTRLAQDPQRGYVGPVWYYLSEGRHTLTLRLKQEAVAIDKITFLRAPEPRDYGQTLARWEALGASDSSGYLAEYEAEAGYLKNDVALFATYDITNAHVTPSSPSRTRYNTIGKSTWKEMGQEITWEFEVPRDGYYCLAFKAKQSDKANSYSVRSLTIDGASPFKEAEVIKFPYSTKWYVQSLEDGMGEPAKLYLTAGRHVLGLQVSMDEEMAEVLRGVRNVAEDLQDMYREIISFTGFNADYTRVTIDANRDFNLQDNIPGLLDRMERRRQQLELYYETIDKMEYVSASSASVLKEMAVMLETLQEKPNKISRRVEYFRSNISSVATWAIDMQAQPLTLDKFYVYSPDVETPEVGGGGWEQFAYRTKMFINSFVADTVSVAGVKETEGDKTLRVWISTGDITTTEATSGRDQAIILKRLIDESFVARTGVNVEVSLVNSSDMLIQAVLAGEGPDVALFTSTETPVNLGMRGALLDLTRFADYQEVLGQFMESAAVPFWYKGGLYALPETQSFNVLFYRTDIYEQLGLEPPRTWEEFYEQIVFLSNANYMVGVPQMQSVFETYLYQRGKSFYNQDLTRSTFHTAEALQAFGDWTDLYTKYSLSLVFDFFNRFRSGEMPLAIEPFSQVNYLYSAAPELDGLWDIAAMPGIEQEDGSINNVVTASSTGAVILADTKYPDEAYEFLKWWVGADTQAEFGICVEQNMGTAARYRTANREAFESIPWTPAQAEVIRQQWENTVAVEQIPGSYYIARNLSFAFRGVVYNKKNIRETLYKYNIEINKELTRKQKEFNY